MKNPPARIQGPGVIGCWRSHANAWSHIISSGISSALILEDDVDFSVGIRDILEGVSTHLQGVLGNQEPYGMVDGNSWDMLALGHCHHRLPDPKIYPKAARQIQSWVDPYAPESDNLSEQFLPGTRSKNIRVLAPAKEMRCTHAYAVTRAGAMRLLYGIGGPGRILDRQMDWIMMDMLDQGLLKGYLTLPTIFGQWGYGDWRGTDIQLTLDKHVGSWPDIIQSVRSEMAEVLLQRNVWDEYEREQE